MIFSSSIFLFCFLPFVLFLYYISPGKIKNITLLLASLLFYWWGQPSYLYLLLISIAVNWLGALLIHIFQNKAAKCVSLVVTLLVNVGLLGVFKYADFAITTFNQITSGSVPLANIVLPIGISFFTFQGMSYVIDVYRGNGEVCLNPLDTALYISLFPQLIAGPIIKYNEVYKQIKNREHSVSHFYDGIHIFVIGLAKKVLISNVLAETADDIFGALPDGIDCPSAWLGIICYTLQIYFDFSGYSDMAIGLGKMFGFHFPKNFNYPYISTSITDFWRRWHISLSTWFRDYIYIPLGGSRTGNRTFNLLAVFFVTGLWHGASWNFVLWGLWYGILLVLEKPLLKTKLYSQIPIFIKWIATMFIVILGWVLFRAPDLAAAVDYIKVMFGRLSFAADAVDFSFAYYIDARLLFTLIIAVIACCPIAKLFRKQHASNIPSYKILILDIIKTIYIFSLLIICIIYIVNNVYNPFIYFQF